MLLLNIGNFFSIKPIKTLILGPLTDKTGFNEGFFFNGCSKF